jgi:alkylated DNA repair protein alkB family protein 6
VQPHEDGPAYFPTVTTLSLGSHTILDIFEYASEENDAGKDSTEGARTYKTEPAFSILIPKRSLFILRSDLYSQHLHGISARQTDSLEQLRKCVNWEDISSRRSRWELGDDTNDTSQWERTRRVSLTIRTVEKVLNLKGFMR